MQLMRPSHPSTCEPFTPCCSRKGAKLPDSPAVPSRSRRPCGECLAADDDVKTAAGRGTHTRTYYPCTESATCFALKLFDVLSKPELCLDLDVAESFPCFHCTTALCARRQANPR
jgi:hypothetical protein